MKKAFNDITARVKKLKNKPKLEGILIAQQVKADLELVVGASLDAEMGPVRTIARNNIAKLSLGRSGLDPDNKRS